MPSQHYYYSSESFRDDIVVVTKAIIIKYRCARAAAEREKGRIKRKSHKFLWWCSCLCLFMYQSNFYVNISHIVSLEICRLPLFHEIYIFMPILESLGNDGNEKRKKKNCFITDVFLVCYIFSLANTLFFVRGRFHVMIRSNKNIHVISNSEREEFYIKPYVHISAPS